MKKDFLQELEKVLAFMEGEYDKILLVTDERNPLCARMSGKIQGLRHSIKLYKEASQET